MAESLTPLGPSTLPLGSRVFPRRHRGATLRSPVLSGFPWLRERPLRREMVHETMWRKFLDALPHAQSLTEEDWQRRHRIMLWVLGLHVPALGVFGLALGYTPE